MKLQIGNWGRLKPGILQKTRFGQSIPEGGSEQNRENDPGRALGVGGNAVCRHGEKGVPAIGVERDRRAGEFLHKGENTLRDTKTGEAEAEGGHGPGGERPFKKVGRMMEGDKLWF